MSVNLVRKVRLIVGAATAKPGPAIGQALGPLGLNMADFCKQFNEATKNYVPAVPIPVELSAYSNRTFKFTTKTPTTSWFIKKCANIEKGASRPGHEIAGQIHVKELYEIAKIKKRDKHLAHLNLETLCRIIMGSCQSMGVQVVGGKKDPFGPGEPAWGPSAEEEYSRDVADGKYSMPDFDEEDE